MSSTRRPDLAEDRHTSRLGERLRRVRQQQGLSLHEVEETSDGRLKASVVGAYERGERAVSITRLQVLADFYRVPIAELLPDAIESVPGEAAADTLEVTIDLAALEQREQSEPALSRYVRSIQQRRGDYNGRVLTVRSSDLDMLAAVLDVTTEELHARLGTEGIVR